MTSSAFPVPTAFTPDWLEGHRVDVSTLARADVVGIGHVMAEVDLLAARLREPERAAAMGLEPPRGILFWGAPGTGKTLVARYLGNSLGAAVPFYEVSADELTPDRIRGTLRHLAMAHPRSVLYADEIDTIGMARDYPGHDPDTRMRLTALLAALDGVVGTAGPVVIASSNRPPRMLDQALMRPGRLGSYMVRFDEPDEDERAAILHLFTRHVPTDASVDWQHLARLTRGATPAALRQIVQDAASLALAADRDGLRMDDLLGAVRRSGRIEPEPEGGEELRHRTAVHEAGHVAACVALRGPSWVYSVQLGVQSGSTDYGDERLPEHMRPDDEVRDALVVRLAGIEAERAVLGEAAQDGHSDVSTATQTILARIATGLGTATPIDLDPLGRNVAESLKIELGADLVDQILRARERAKAIVVANTGAIDRFAAVLEVAGELTGDELKAAINAAGFTEPGA